MLFLRVDSGQVKHLQNHSSYYLIFTYISRKIFKNNKYEGHINIVYYDIIYVVVHEF